jgi:uncharacterized cupredoxin-like copper-binding protein
LKRFLLWAVLVTTLVAATTVDLHGSGIARSTEPVSEVNLSLADIRFDPKEVTIPANVDVTFHLTNTGGALHNFSIDELNVDEDLASGESKDVVINAPAGEYKFFCSVPGHEAAGMLGTLIVQGESDVQLTEPASPEAGDESTAPVVVELVDIAFVPSEISVTANTATTVKLMNTGAAPHNFSIDELGIDEDLAPGETLEIEIDAPSGDYEFYCNVPGHKEAGMIGTLTVQDSPAPKPSATPAKADTDDASVEDRLAALEKRVAALETAIALGSPEVVPTSFPAATTGDGTRTSPAAVGETVERSGVEVTLLNAQVVEIDTIVQPDEGQVFLALDLRIENKGSDSVNYGDSHVSAKDIEQGFEFEDTSDTFLAPLPLQTGELAPDDFVRGAVIVLVSESSKDLLIRYTSEPYGEGEEYFWTLTLD